jgi:hypothetical protein
MKFGKVLLALMVGLSISVAEAANFADYAPLTLGSFWTYQNAANPASTYTDAVFDSFIFNGNQAAKYGNPSSYIIGYNDGSSVYLYGEGNSSGQTAFPNVISLGVITDGMTFNPTPSDLNNLNMIRIWDNLDPAQTAVYNNSQNAIVESNLSSPFPDYAVTGLEWYQPGVGKIITTDVFATTGVIGERYNLLNYSIAAVPLPSAVLLFGTGLFGLLGLKRCKHTIN